MRPQRSVATHGAHTSPSSERKITELRSREGKSTVRIDRKPRLVVGGKLNLHGNAAQGANVTEP